MRASLRATGEPKGEAGDVSEEEPERLGNRWGVRATEGRRGEKEAVVYRTGEGVSPGRRCIGTLLNGGDSRESEGLSSVKGRNVGLKLGGHRAKK